MDFQFELIRLWESQAEKFLEGDVGSLPLAVLSKLPEGSESTSSLAAVVNRLLFRLDEELPIEHVRRLMTASYVLTGLRIDKQAALELFKGAKTMRD